MELSVLYLDQAQLLPLANAEQGLPGIPRQHLHVGGLHSLPVHKDPAGDDGDHLDRRVQDGGAVGVRVAFHPRHAPLLHVHLQLQGQRLLLSRAWN